MLSLRNDGSTLTKAIKSMVLYFLDQGKKQHDFSPLNVYKCVIIWFEQQVTLGLYWAIIGCMRFIFNKGAIAS